MLPDLKTLRNLVRQLAQEEVLPRFADVQRHTKLDGSVVTEADIAFAATVAAGVGAAMAGIRFPRRGNGRPRA